MPPSGDEKGSSTPSKWSWMKETDAEVTRTVMMRGVYPSKKDENRQYRIEFYMEQIAKLNVELCHYKEMLRLEEQKQSARERDAAGDSSSKDDFVEVMAGLRQLGVRQGGSATRNAIKKEEFEEGFEDFQ